MHYEITALTSHYGFRDLVTSRLGRGHRILNLTSRLVSRSLNVELDIQVSVMHM